MMINAIDKSYQNSALHPEKMAIADIKHGVWSFREIFLLSTRVQNLMKTHGISTGDSVLVAITPSPSLYAVLCGLMGLGVRIVFIEPWLGLDRINHVIEMTKPKAFLTSGIGKLWGFRSSGIRKIPLWLTPADIAKSSDTGEFTVTPLSPDHHAFIVFSSGTTGAPKGVIRTHDYMYQIYNVFVALEPQHWQTPDLVIFPNVVLFHLGTGRGSVIVPHRWSRRNLEKVFGLCEKFRPETLSTGPAFLKTLMDMKLLHRLRFLDRLVIGGALTDCWIMEKVFHDLPMIKVKHIYGGSEAEPVAFIDARVAVRESRRQGFFQTLCIGEAIPQLKTRFKDDILWVSGPNVAGEYIGHPDENKGIKERDTEGNLWHCMGDRITSDQGLLWYTGRERQKKEDFLLEQSLYSFLQSSRMFIHRTENDEVILLGEDLSGREKEIRKNFPQINRIIETKIYRDKRHRSRIDRKKSLRL